MKRLLFVAGSLRIGGIERSLVNLLKHIDYSMYKVDLFLYANEGEYFKDLPYEVRLINQSRLLHILGLTMEEAKKKKNFYIVFVRVFGAILCRTLGSKKFWSIVFKLIPKPSGYDVAIAFSHNVHHKSLYSGYYQFILDRVDAKIKIGWVHTDYQSMGILSNKDRIFFNNLDRIVNVSFAGKNIFDLIFPEYQQKSYVVNNMVPVEQVKNLSLENIQNQFSSRMGFIGITVARLDRNKSIDRIIKAVGRLQKLDLNINWLIIGDGPQRNALKKITDEYGLTENIFFLGMQSNPYPFIRIANLFVLCSRYEGFPMTIYESLVIGTPVLVTRYEAADEQIKNGYNGIIADNSEEGLFIALRNLLNQPQLLKQMKENLINERINNDRALAQFHSLIETTA